jgi:transposase
MTRQERTYVRYSLSFKHHVIRDIEQGVFNISEASRHYELGSGTIQKWLRNFGKNHLLSKKIIIQTVQEKDHQKAMEQEIKKLKEALAEAYMEKRILEGLIDEANKAYNTDLKKNFGDQSSKPSAPGSQ